MHLKVGIRPWDKQQQGLGPSTSMGIKQAEGLGANTKLVLLYVSIRVRDDLDFMGVHVCEDV